MTRIERKWERQTLEKVSENRIFGGGDKKKYTGPVKKGNCTCKKDMRIKNNRSVSVRLLFHSSQPDRKSAIHVGLQPNAI